MTCSALSYQITILQKYVMITNVATFNSHSHNLLKKWKMTINT